MQEDGTVSEKLEPRYLRILKNIDALGCSLIAKRATTGEFISTYVWRVRKIRAILFIDFLFGEIGHCEASFEGQKDDLNLTRDKE
jgi:hypothetical protein